MQELIKIESSEEGKQTVNARELHQFLEVGKDFSSWIKDRIEAYGFTEGQDYLLTKIGEQLASGTKYKNEYFVSLDMAKELAMVERNAKGKQARQYFIECERKAKSTVVDPVNLLNDPAAMRGMLLSYTEKVLTLEESVKALTPKSEAFDLIAAGEDAITLTEAAKVVGIKRSLLTARLHAEGWIFRLNKSWVAYDKYIKNGYLRYKEARYTSETTGMDAIKPYCHVTPKGLAKLALMLSSPSSNQEAV